MPSHPFIIRPPRTAREFEAYYQLRWQVLREPWQQPRGSEQDDLETAAVHRAAFETDQLRAVGRLHLIDATTGHIRYMAVHPAAQKRGLGSLILQSLETEACILRLDRLVLNARDSALKFYQQHGYRVCSPGPTHWGVRHLSMEKLL